MTNICLWVSKFSTWNLVSIKLEENCQISKYFNIMCNCTFKKLSHRYHKTCSLHLTLSEVVDAVRQAWAPSYLPIVTLAGKIFWLRFKVNTGTNIVYPIHIWKENQWPCLKKKICVWNKSQPININDLRIYWSPKIKKHW